MLEISQTILYNHSKKTAWYWHKTDTQTYGIKDPNEAHTVIGS
jgi:hypothetical protein